MHSSRMRTSCLLPVSPSMHCSKGGSASGPWRVPSSGLEEGGSASGWGGACLWSPGGGASQHTLGQTTPLWTEWQARVKTQPLQTSYVGGNHYSFNRSPFLAFTEIMSTWQRSITRSDPTLSNRAIKPYMDKWNLFTSDKEVFQLKINNYSFFALFPL